MTPTPRAAAVLALVALSLLVLPVPVPVLLAVALAAAAGVDAWWARRPPVVTREAPTQLARGVPAELRLVCEEPARVRLRQPTPPDLELEPAEADRELVGRLVARRRGRHTLPAPVARRTGPLGLAAWTHRVGEPAEIRVFPDLPAARRLATSVRAGTFRDEGLRRRGPLGLGTEFESVRDYSPDDDVRQVNWRATARLARPMSNQYRIERDRDVVCVVDCGRLMAAPFADRTRLDAALDAAVAVAAVADVLGDRCGTIAFSDEVLRRLPPRRAGARDLVTALYDLEPLPVDSDYELAFSRFRGVKRAFVLVLTDLLEESAARPLVEALPVIARRHAVAVASAADADLDAAVSSVPGAPGDVYRAAVALEVLAARARAAAQLRRAGAIVVESPPPTLAAACVRAYLRAKWTARL
ncbi:MAG TPA: DUF58 domain-containing protein [Gaiellaceae bacterium]|nr:DUF58 domain-containing protein [Gaiellaceae bacterium]